MERKASAGKDQKITALLRETEELRKQLTEAQAAAEGRAGQDAGEVKRMMEIAADLKAREKEMADKQEALRVAVAKGVSVNLMLRGAGDLDNFITELADFQRQTWAGKGYKPKGAVEPTDKLKLERLAKSEVARIPSRIFEKLLEQKS
jgi:hypothetical protein